MSNHKLLFLTFFRGRVALYVMLKALGIGDGDLVACQAFTCEAVPEAILATGAKPLYIDTEKDGFNMDPISLKDRITKPVKAVIVQHTYGIPAKIDEICDYLDNHNIPVIEDCCLSMFSTYKGKNLGSFGIACFYSYEWGKPLVAGIGGSLVINDQRLVRKVKSIIETFSLPPLVVQVKILLQFIFFVFFYKPSTYWTVRRLFHFLSKKGFSIGNFNSKEVLNDYNLKMIPLCKFLLRLKIRRMKTVKNSLKRVMSFYNHRFVNTKISLKELNVADIYLSRYPLLMCNREEKQKVLAEAMKKKIEVSDWYSTPIHPLKRSVDFEKFHYKLGTCPNAEDVADRVITFPVNQKVSKRVVCKSLALLKAFNDESR